jgi:hypothetical protein
MWLRKKKSGNFTYSFEKDEQEFRNWSLLTEYADMREAIEDYPDWDAAYLRAAYPTGFSEDHTHARPEFLRLAIGKVKAESSIHARLSCYEIWSGNYEQGFCEAVQSFLLAPLRPCDGPSDKVPCSILVAGVLAEHGFRAAASAVSSAGDGYDLGDEEGLAVKNAITKLSKRSHRAVVTDGALALRRAGTV